MTALAAARTGIVAGGALVGLLSANRAYDVDQPWLWGSDLAVTVAFAIVAAVAMPTSWRLAALSAGVALSWALAGWWPFAAFWHRGFLIHLLVLLIAGVESLWPRGIAGRVLIVAGYVVSATPFIWTSDAATLALAVGVVAAAFVLRPRRPGSAGATAIGALIALGTVFALAAVMPIASPAPAVFAVRAVVYALALVVIAALIVRASGSRPLGGATDAVVELGAVPDDALRDRLAAVLGDRSLEIGWWSTDAGRFLARDGSEVTAPAAGGARRSLTVEVAQRPIALVVGNASRLDDPGVHASILRASALATEHSLLADRIREATRQAEESRRRLIRAAESERLALGAELERDVGAPLRALGADLDRVGRPDPIGRVASLVERALAELDAIARGLHPSILDRGLAEALTQLARQTPLVLALRVETDPTDPAIAQVAYYVCAEAIANAVRHASCTTVTVHVQELIDGVEVSIEDDGTGGVDVRPGSGLQGLMDRVARVGGTLVVRSPVGRGTVVRARLPHTVTAQLAKSSL